MITEPETIIQFQGTLAWLHNIFGSLARKFDRNEIREFYKKASKEDKDKLWKWIKDFDFNAIDLWVLAKQYTNLDTLNLRQLRALAQKYSIKYYTILTKEELREKIHERQHQINKK